MMCERTSRKLSCLQFLCALMIIALHTTFPRYFPESAAWAADLNQYLRQLDDAAISTFFFLSAYLFFRRTEGRSYGQVLLHKLRTLALPYVLWNALFYVYTLLREYQVYGMLFTGTDALTILRKLTIAPANSIFWFLQTLMGFVVLYPLILWCVKRRWPAIAAMVLSAVAVCVPQTGIRYETMLYWVPVYGLGAYIGFWHRERFERFPFAGRPWQYGLAAAVVLGLAALRPLGHQAHYLYWIPVPLCLWVLADGFGRLKRHFWWMDASFYLYCSHMIVEYAAVKLYQLAAGPGTLSAVLGNVLLPCLCAAIALTAGAVVRRLLPGIWGLLTGTRGR